MSKKSRSEFNNYEKRNADEEFEKKLREPLYKVYITEGLNPVYNTDENVPEGVKKPHAWVVSQEKKGRDVVFNPGTDKEMIVDEKAFSSNKNAYQESVTYAFEVATENNKDGNGWLFKDDAVNTHYALCYPQIDISGQLRKAEVIVIDRNIVLDFIRQNGFTCRDDVEKYIDENGSMNIENGRIKAVVNDKISIVHSLNLAEQSLVITINRDWLREHADMVIDADMEKVKAKYALIQQNKTIHTNVPSVTKPQNGLYFQNSQKDLLKKYEKVLPSLRGKTLQPFAVTDRQDDISDAIGTNAKVSIMGYAPISNDSVILKAQIEGKNAFSYLVAGKPQPNLDIDKLSFKPTKSPFKLIGQNAVKTSDGTIIKKQEELNKESAPVKNPDKSEIDKSGLGNMSIDDFFADPNNNLEISNEEKEEKEK